MKATEEKKKKMREYAKTHRKQFNEYQRKYINKLKEEGKKIPTTNYKSRIDKAIEYIRNNSYRFSYYEETDEGQIDLSKCKYKITSLRATKVKQLLDILKGDDK